MININHIIICIETVYKLCYIYSHQQTCGKMNIYRNIQ